MNFRRSLTKLWPVAGFILTLGCRPLPPVPEVDLTMPFPAVAAEFRTVRTENGVRSAVDWRLWRDPDRIVVENLTERVAHYWQRDGRVVFHRAVFHDERRGVEFQPGDLDLLGASQDWNERGLLFEPRLLSQLRAGRTGWRDGRPYRRYAGELDGTSWSVTLAVDSMLPLELNRRTAAGDERTTLVAAFSAAAAPWAPLPTADYELIDFADFGDRGTDPFVTRMEARLGLGHAQPGSR